MASVPVQPGNSGGPLVDEDGYVIGIVVSKLSDLNTLEITGQLPQNVNYAVKSSFALAILEAVSEFSAELTKPYKEKREFEEVVRQTEKSVVLVLGY